MQIIFFAKENYNACISIRFQVQISTLNYQIFYDYVSVNSTSANITKCRVTQVSCRYQDVDQALSHCCVSIAHILGHCWDNVSWWDNNRRMLKCHYSDVKWLFQQNYNYKSKVKEKIWHTIISDEIWHPLFNRSFLYTRVNVPPEVKHQWGNLSVLGTLSIN